MMVRLQRLFSGAQLWVLAVVGAVLIGSFVLGAQPRALVLVALAVVLGLVILLQRPATGPVVLILAALLLRKEFGTGTAVTLNLVALLIPALVVLWFVEMVLSHQVSLVPSRVNRPLWLFLLAGLVSVLVGNALWDPAVPRSDNLILVQLAQWAIFAFSAGAFWLTANRISNAAMLQRLTFVFLALAGSLAILIVLGRLTGSLQLYQLLETATTFAVQRAPFWMLLAALTAGQLLFNRDLASSWRVFLGAVMGAVVVYALYFERQTLANWLGIAAAIGLLGWLRWPRLRWIVILVLLAMLLTGFLFSALFEFAGGEAEWAESGGSRLVLIGRVLEVTMRNPITGLGPGSYRLYAGIEPLSYGPAYWISPQINSHNNYVDLFAHVGVLGLALFSWFAIELARLGLRLRTCFTQGFAAGYVNGALAAGLGALVLMMFADWILPFVYNIGFPGFQASVLVWLFLGGLVALEQVAHA